ncbi:hypothetical protein [Arthrobacter rhombi]|uniref:hypothetical protein n=1 Tax=Arthrobacter rhombi TaxID=71253 RepID=UPI003FD525D9
MAYKIDPAQLHAILVDVAADGESLRLAAKDTKTSGDEASGDFGTATTVSAAFARFWTPAMTSANGRPTWCSVKPPPFPTQHWP